MSNERMKIGMWMLAAVAAGFAAGCPQVRHVKLPESTFRKQETSTGRDYWMYVPSRYTRERSWPLVVTLHGTYGYDWAWEQAKEWDSLAEEQGFLVVAPRLKSVQGVLPVASSIRRGQLEEDDETILAVIDEVCAQYNVDRKAILLTGFSAGGFPLWNTGLRHPERFSMLIGRSANCDLSLVRDIPFTDVTRKLPMAIYWGKDDLKPIRDNGWDMFRFLRVDRQCYKAVQKKIAGGHWRKPDVAYEFWRPYMPEAYRPAPKKKALP